MGAGAAALAAARSGPEVDEEGHRGDDEDEDEEGDAGGDEGDRGGGEALGTVLGGDGVAGVRGFALVRARAARAVIAEDGLHVLRVDLCGVVGRRCWRRRRRLEGVGLVRGCLGVV